MNSAARLTAVTAPAANAEVPETVTTKPPAKRSGCARAETVPTSWPRRISHSGFGKALRPGRSRIGSSGTAPHGCWDTRPFQTVPGSRPRATAEWSRFRSSLTHLGGREAIYVLDNCETPGTWTSCIVEGCLSGCSPLTCAAGERGRGDTRHREFSCHHAGVTGLAPDCRAELVAKPSREDAIDPFAGQRIERPCNF